MTSIHSIEHNNIDYSTGTVLHYEDYYLLYYKKGTTRANDSIKNVY